MKPIFKASQFKALVGGTATAQDKADFANNLIRFILSGFKPTLFSRKLYRRLSQTFGFIAHYNAGGFYHEYFTNMVDRKEFIRQLRTYTSVGSPFYTFSDVEDAIQEWLDDDANFALVWEAFKAPATVGKGCC